VRNPRVDPRKGDILEHLSGEKRAVVERRSEDPAVSYSVGSQVAECSTAQWQEWAKQTSILGLAD
jgi:hypothetical protein